MIRHLLLMSGLGGSCLEDCSGRGECLNGTCLCEIRFSGDICDGPNVPYHAGIGGGFLLVALVCAVQLLMNVISEYQKLKTPTLLRACRITTQKLLYFLAFLACIIRGAYFTSPDAFKHGWASSLLSAYYPILMSGSSLIVCFWAEVFHLRDIHWETPQFLSKSFLGFVTFNIINYGLLLTEFITTQIANTSPDDKHFFTHIFNGCYAVLMFIVVIFFLIYGVEVYFKVRGGFLRDTVTTIANNRKTAEDGSGEANAESQSALFDNDVPSADDLHQKVNTSQLHQSRFGLLAQAFMLIIIVGFLFSETLSEFWKKKVPVYSRNWHDLVFRVVEIGVALWFPCVLWNCMSPAELWILNPRKLITHLEPEPKSSETDGDAKPGSSTGEEEAPLNKQDCWICYDSEKNDPLIQPCQCTGDVSSVHHECLKRWLMETSANAEYACKVCGCKYNVQHTTRLDWGQGFTSQHWGITALVVTSMCVSVAGAWVVIQLFEDPYIRMFSASVALLVIYICIRFLGVNTVDAYQRAKVGALNIISGSENHVSTISETVAVDIPKQQTAQTAI